ncbi:hypothetical protein [Larkinella sp. C7]|uniref:hypothetical protein n=1 Tax=Larkinella sp. C7 TaxID=2576607 RepID=UPI001111579D|nr:hypothetical protein [Larkinella sp. C7]
MSILFVFLQQYLLIHFGIRPELVGLDTNFRHDLNLSEEAIEKLLATVGAMTGTTLPADGALYLTDVFDLLIHVLLRSKDVEFDPESGNPSKDCESDWDWFHFQYQGMLFQLQTHLN